MPICQDLLRFLSDFTFKYRVACSIFTLTKKCFVPHKIILLKNEKSKVRLPWKTWHLHIYLVITET